MKLKRRRFLCSSLVLLAGCASRNQQSGETPEQPPCDEPTPATTTARGDILREVEVRNVDSSPVNGTSFSVRLPRRAMTTDHPATVEIAFRNEGSESREFGFGRPAPFATRVSDQRPGWTLLDAESLSKSDEPTRVTEDCWKPDYDDQSAYEQLDIVDYYELNRCDVLSETYQLWTHFRHEECMPVGQYRFEDTVHLKEAPDPSEETQFRWGFSLEISDP